MEFKFDTKNSYTIITPETTALDAYLAGNLEKDIAVHTNNGNRNYIIDLKHCTTADNKSFEVLKRLHEFCYNNNSSLVFTNIAREMMPAFKEVSDELNIAPAMAEAVDIVSMEILERDLLNEDDDF